jgi:hypothetical protein
VLCACAQLCQDPALLPRRMINETAHLQVGDFARKIKIGE